MAWIETGDARLYYEVHGGADEAAAAPWVVLLHGVGGNHASWFYQVAAWRERFRVVVVDARGFGRSTDPGNIGRDAFVDDLERLFDAAHIDRAVLIGQSMGGGTAVSYTCRHPDRVNALVLADTLFGVELPDGVRDEMDAVGRYTATLSQQERVLGSTFRRQQPGLSMLYTALASFNGVNVRTLTGVQTLHSPREIAAVGVPVLFVVGEEDALFPSHAVRAVQRELPGSGFVELPGVGHSAYFEAPDAFNAVVVDWLAGALGPTA